MFYKDAVSRHVVTILGQVTMANSDILKSLEELTSILSGIVSEESDTIHVCAAIGDYTGISLKMKIKKRAGTRQLRLREQIWRERYKGVPKS